MRYAASLRHAFVRGYSSRLTSLHVKVVRRKLRSQLGQLYTDIHGTNECIWRSQCSDAEHGVSGSACMYHLVNASIAITVRKLKLESNLLRMFGPNATFIHNPA